jgi:hypothetical protein
MDKKKGKTKTQIKKEIHKKQVEKIERYFDSLADKGLKHDMLEWIGYVFFEKMFNLYLFHKYKLECLGLAQDWNYYGSAKIVKFKELSFSLVPSSYSDAYVEDKTFNSLIAKTIAECINRKKELIPIPVGITWLEGTGNDENIKAHANVLIYRAATNSIEHFEPYGSYLFTPHDIKFTTYPNDIRIQKKIRKFIDEINVELKKYKLPDVTLITSNICCPYRGLQGIEGNLKKKITKTGKKESEGYCAAWSLLFIELILKNPKLDSTIINKIIFKDILSSHKNRKPEYLRNVIRGFVISVDEKVRNYFSEMFGIQVDLENVNENTIDFETELDFFIDIEIKKIYNKNYNIKDDIDYPPKYLGLHIKNLERLANTIAKVTPPSPTTPSPSSKHSIEDYAEEGPAPKPHQIKKPQKPSPKPSPKRLLTKKKLPRCPNGTRRNKKTGKCEPK